MPITPAHEGAYGYLQEARSQVLRSVDGLKEYDLRRPMTPTGTNLLGVVKHLVGIEGGYLGVCLEHPVAFSLPWINDKTGGPIRDMWATAAESPAYILDLYRRACDHSDVVLSETVPAARANVPWWPEGQRTTTVAALVARVSHDTAMHAGQLQILRELIDGQAGNDRQALGDDRWWSGHVGKLEALARTFRS